MEPVYLWYHLFVDFVGTSGAALLTLALDCPVETEPAGWPGLTLGLFAQARGQSLEQARPFYKNLMRSADRGILPAATRVVDAGGAIKFCLPAGFYNNKALETESVILPMRNAHGGTWYTLCVSSQVGCRMGCTFCQTGRMGLLSQLTAVQIVQQFLVARRMLREQKNAVGIADTSAENVAAAADHPRLGGWQNPNRVAPNLIRNLVFMGMGEPLDNLDAVVQALGVLSDPAGINLPLSRITVSTVGRIDGLRRLAKMDLPGLKLAISITAANDQLRSKLMPINRAMPLAELKQALMEYPRGRRTRFFIEYVLLAGVNDSPAHAMELVEWCRGLPVKINVIPYNPQQPTDFSAPADDVIVAFMETLRLNGILAKRRVTIGQDLMGACGQLGNPALRR